MEINFLKIFKLSATLIAILSAAAFLNPTQSVIAQTADETSALQELSQISGQQITNTIQAKEICDLEKYMTDCASIGKKYNLYKPDEIKQVDAVLEELKGKIAEDLKNCASEECLIGVANKLAQSIVKKNPVVAKQFDLTPAQVEEKKTIINAAKEAGVSFNECQAMNPDTASVDLLRACAKLAKDSRVQKYIPEDKKQYIDQTEATAKLRETLSKGEYQCGDNTLEGCGNYCMKPSLEVREQEVSAIPPVCRAIAEKFYGPEGVKQLELSYSQVSQASDFYYKKANQATFKTIDGKVLLNPQDIGRYVEEGAKKGNIEAVEKGMDFMTAQGFVNQKDKEFALKMVRKVKESGRELNFDDCRNNPQACSQFIPDEEKDKYEASGKIFQLMNEELKKEGLPDMGVCNDPDNAEKCLKASQRVLPQLRAIAGYSSEAAQMVRDIEERMNFSRQGLEAQNKARREFEQAGKFMIGDKEFRSFEEMSKFCQTNSTNSQECLAAAAQKGFIDKNFATEKFEKVYESREFSGQGPYQGFQPGVYPPPGQIPGFTSAGQGFGLPAGLDKEKALQLFKEWLDNPQGAPPIPGFVQPMPYLQPGATSTFPDRIIGPVCRNPAPPPCPFGQYRTVSPDQNGCPLYGGCVSSEQPKPIEQPRPGPMPGVSKDECVKRSSEGYQWSEQFGCYIYPKLCPSVMPQPCPQGTHRETKPWECIGTCVPDNVNQPVCPSMPTVDSCPSGQVKYVTWSSPECGSYYACKSSEEKIQTCPSGEYWNGTACVNSTTPTTSNWVNHTWKFKDGSENSYILNRTDSEYLNYISGIESQCLSIEKSRFAWKLNAGNDSASNWQNFGIPDCSGSTTTQTCPAGQYWNGTSCMTSGGTSYPGDANSCPGFAYSRWDSTGTRYCQLNNEARCDFEYPSYLTNSNYRAEECPTTTSQNTTCGSGQYWNGSGCVTSTPTSTSGQRQMMWNSLGLSSQIRNDADAARIEQLKQACANVPPGTNIWMPNAGTYSSPDFGMPDSAKCSSFGFGSGSGGGTGCSAYMSQGTCVNASSARCDWRTSGSSGWCQTSSGTAACGNYICESGETTSCAADCIGGTSAETCGNNYCGSGETSTSCPSDCGGSTTSSCPAGDYWNGSYCVSSTSQTSQSSQSCPSGEYWDTRVNACRSMVAACSEAGGTWDGTTCVMPSTTQTTSQTCPSDQYWDSTTNTCKSNMDPATACSQAGGSWDGSTCVMPTTNTSNTGTMDPATGCSQAGGTWDGTTCIMPSALNTVEQQMAKILSNLKSLLENIAAFFSR